MYKTQLNKRTGFTLIEIMLSIALLMILASITIIAINPSKQLADSRDAQREADTFTLVQAVYQYASDYEGDFPSIITTDETEICATNATSCEGLSDLSALTDSEKYLIAVPVDPLCASVVSACGQNGTGYYIKLTENGRLYVNASSSENKNIIVIQ